MDLLIGTGNAGKLDEFQAMFAGLPVRLLSLNDVGLGDMDVPEDATTLEENARLKAEAYANASGLVTLADDTGLFVETLGGRPGVYPARYGGPGLTMAERRAKLLGELAGLPDEKRTARFECVINVYDPTAKAEYVVKGICEGKIAQAEANGAGGFGYDPVFVPEGYEMSFSQLPADVKNEVSHRGRAAVLIAPILRALAEKV